MRFFKWQLFFILLSTPIYAQMPNLSPSMQMQLQNMSSDDQRRMAQQYGVDLSSLGSVQSSLDSSSLGEKVDPLASNPDQVLYKRLMQGNNNQEKLEAIEKNLTPIFERNYDDIDDLPIYGRSIFDNEVSTYASVDNAPVPDNYRIGVGDTLNITLYGSENIERELNVSRSGEVNFPKIGSLNVAGMTFGQMNDYIKERISRELIGAKVSISMGSLRSINVFVAGEARVAGVYSVSALATVSQVLYVAGGVSEIGSLRNIEIKNNGNRKATFDFYDLLTAGDTAGDIRLQSGDVIFAPPIDRTVIIDGAVRRPGRYEVIKNETLADLIKLAGGLTNRAYLKKIFIERYMNNADLPVIVNLNISDDANADFVMEDGDIVRIASVSNQSNNSITIKGAVERPGKYGWYNDITVTDIIQDLDVDFLSNVDVKQALIVRRKTKNSNDIFTISFDLGKAMSQPKSTFDLKLQPFDEVLIFSLNDNEELTDLIERQDPDDIQSINRDESQVNDSDEGIVNNFDSGAWDSSFNNVMSNDEFNELFAEKKLELQRMIRVRGSRANLLSPVLKKLYSQASINEPIQVVFINGGVKAPGEYPLSLNANFANLVQLAGGYTDNALIELAEIRRLEIDSKGSIETVLINIDLRKDISSTTLKSRDHIRINKIKDWDNDDSILLQGEVFYPGTYLIAPNEKLSSVIQRAGGLTDESFVNGAIFSRESIKKKEKEQLLILGNNIRRDQASRSMTKESGGSFRTSEEVENSIAALLSTEAVGRLIIDLPRIIYGDQSADLVLQDGDVLTVPRYNNAVTVVGEVRRSGSFVRQESFNVDDYIELAAGMTERGDSKKAYVIRADGSVDQLIGFKKRKLLTFSGSSEAILAGDTIVIPIKSSYQTPLNLYSTVSQVIFQSIASIAAITTVIK